MNDRSLDNQFAANSLSPEQLRQMQNLAALTGQGLLGNNLNNLNNLNLLNPIALRNLINPLLAATRGPSNLINSDGVDHSPVTGIGSLGASLEQASQQQPQLPISVSLPQQPPPQQQQQQQQQNMTLEFTQRLQQQIQQMLRQTQRQQQQQAHSSQILPGGGEPSASISIRQQQSLQNSSHHVSIPDQQKRKRGRPPLSKPTASTSGPSGAGPNIASALTIDPNNYMNVLSAFKTIQDRAGLHRENKMLQERQRELRKQQELEQKQREMKLAAERAERQREMRAQQERERQRLEMERQRKAQHRMALLDIDRERRRQHTIMIRNLEAYKRNEEREKTVTAMMAERNKINERRVHQKRLEAELIKDIRKPVDDMQLKNQRPLATLNRIPGLKLPGKAFADLLMSFEFLYNFGDTVGLDVKSLPDINTLQQGLLNLNSWAEDQLISIMHHLCMFAIKDPRFPYSGPTKEIVDLEASNEGLSQLLHFYLQVITLGAKTEMKHENRLYKLIEQKYFLALNATQKAEMLAFICNELLCSQTVTKQMEDTIENVAKLRKDKWVLENELRKYRAIKTRRELQEEIDQKNREAAEAAAALEASNNPEKTNGQDPEGREHVKREVTIKREQAEKEKNSKAGLTNGSSKGEEEDIKKEKEDNQPPKEQAATNDLDDSESQMTNDELYKKIENLTRQYNKTSNKLEKAIYSMRSNPLGQDRYRRRYWALPQVGGVFVEGMESSEPEELANNVFTDEELVEFDKEEEMLNELANNHDNNNIEPSDQQDEANQKAGIKVEDKEDDEVELKEDGEDKDDDEGMDTKDEETTEANDIEDETKSDALENGDASEGDKNCETAPKQETSDALVTSSIAWFSILPRNVCDFTKQGMMKQQVVPSDRAEDENGESNRELTDEELREKRHEICPTLAKRLDELEAEQYEQPRKIHPRFQYGWWRITDSQQLKAMEAVLHERGSRERILHKHLSKYFQYACISCRNTTVDFEITSYDRQLAGKNYGAPVPHTDDDSADDLKDGEEDEEEDDVEMEYDEETGDDKIVQQQAAPPVKKSKRKKSSSSARSRRLRARAAARKKVENSKKLAQKVS